MSALRGHFISANDRLRQKSFNAALETKAIRQPAMRSWNPTTDRP